MQRKIKLYLKSELIAGVLGGLAVSELLQWGRAEIQWGIGILSLMLLACSSQTVKLFQTPLPAISSVLKRLEICRQQSDSWTTRRNNRWVRLRAGALPAVNWISVLIEDPALPPCAELWEQQLGWELLRLFHISSEPQRNAVGVGPSSSTGWSAEPLCSRPPCDSSRPEQGQWHRCWHDNT